MNKPEYNIELIERYFDNDISESEKELILEEIQKDKTLKEMFAREKLLINTIKFAKAGEDLQYLKSLDDSLERGQQGSLRIYYYAAAAIVTILVVVGVVLFRPSPSPSDLYAEYYQPYPNTFEPILRGTESTERSEAFAAYERGDYQTAVSLFDKLLAEKREAGILLLSANAYLSVDQPDKAKPLLQELLESSDALDAHANWYLALCLMKLDDKAEAIKILTTLATTENLYSSRARSLLGKMQ